MANKEQRVPSEEEIGQLPRWAQVAFAARCARRVQPLFKAAWPDAPAESCQALEDAITQAEHAAAIVALGERGIQIDLSVIQAVEKAIGSLAIVQAVLHFACQCAPYERS